MTRNDILGLADVYLNAAVGTHVFEYTNVKVRPGAIWEGIRDLTQQEIDDYAQWGVKHEYLPLEHFSEHWSDMSRVVLKMKDRGYPIFHLSILSDGTVSATFCCSYGPCQLHGTNFHDSHGATENGETAPIAVARAALVSVLLPAEERWR